MKIPLIVIAAAVAVIGLIAWLMPRISKSRNVPSGPNRTVKRTSGSTFTGGGIDDTSIRIQE